MLIMFLEIFSFKFLDLVQLHTKHAKKVLKVSGYKKIANLQISFFCYLIVFKSDLQFVNKLLTKCHLNSDGWQTRKWTWISFRSMHSLDSNCNWYIRSILSVSCTVIWMPTLSLVWSTIWNESIKLDNEISRCTCFAKNLTRTTI
jgi:hypothetical protein